MSYGGTIHMMLILLNRIEEDRKIADNSINNEQSSTLIDSLGEIKELIVQKSKMQLKLKKQIQSSSVTTDVLPE